MTLHAMIHGHCCAQVAQLSDELNKATELIDMQRQTIARLTEEASEDRWKIEALEAALASPNLPPVRKP